MLLSSFQRRANNILQILVFVSITPHYEAVQYITVHYYNNKCCIECTIQLGNNQLICSVMVEQRREEGTHCAWCNKTPSIMQPKKRHSTVNRLGVGGGLPFRTQPLRDTPSYFSLYTTKGPFRLCDYTMRYPELVLRGPNLLVKVIKLSCV